MWDLYKYNRYLFVGVLEVWGLEGDRHSVPLSCHDFGKTVVDVDFSTRPLTRTQMSVCWGKPF